MRHSPLTLVVTLAAVSLFVTNSALAQEPPAPPTRIVTATTVEVPFGPDRTKFVSFLEEYFLPGIQLHPKVKTSDASMIVLVAEYDTFADIEAECGQPCDDYFAQHEAPEEGDAGYEEYEEKLAVFNKYYAKHSDEIFATNMNRAVVEGRMQGRVGPAPESEM